MSASTYILNQCGYRLCVTKEKEENRLLVVCKEYKDILKPALFNMYSLLI